MQAFRKSNPAITQRMLDEKQAYVAALKVLARIIAKRIIADTDKHVNEKIAGNQNEFEDIP